MLVHKICLSKVQKIQIISSIFSNHKIMRVEINYKKKSCEKDKDTEAKICYCLVANGSLETAKKIITKKYLQTNKTQQSKNL